jgi:hypothetical protein
MNASEVEAAAVVAKGLSGHRILLTTKEVAMIDKKELSRAGSFKEAIAQRAYDLYIQRGCQNGNDVEDWLKAEKELVVEPLITSDMRSARAGRAN